MSDRTDETARAIAECQHVDFFNFDPLFKQERFADLQKLAKFWLMRREIVATLESHTENQRQSFIAANTGVSSDDYELGRMDGIIHSIGVIQDKIKELG